MGIKKVTTYYDDEKGFEYTFEPLDDTLTITETESGYEVRYLIQDEDTDSPDEWGDDNLFLVNYHRDFWVERKEVITKDEVRDIYLRGKTDYGDIERQFHIFPLSCLVHSGVWLSLGDSFGSDPGGWDTSHVGLVLVSKKETRYKKKALEIARGLVETWNTYLTGDVYCLVKETYDKDKEPVEYDTLGGVYEHKYALEALKTEI